MELKEEVNVVDSGSFGDDDLAVSIRDRYFTVIVHDGFSFGVKLTLK